VTAFLGKSSFVGPPVAVGTTKGSFVSQARFNGCIAASNWARGDVERLLPPELALAANVSSTPDRHPVLFVFGDLSDGAVIAGGRVIPLGIAYQEFALAIPFVRHRRGNHLHTYVPRMYSSYLPAVWSGNVNYGLAKRSATMRWQGPFFVLTTDAGSLVLHIAVETQQDWSRASSCPLPEFGAMREIFSMPVVGRKGSGAYVCSYFGWDFEDALLRLVDSSISIDGPVVENLLPRRCPDVPGGTFEVRGMIWRLSWPSRCRF